MTAAGMRIKCPSELFLAERPRGASGSVIAATGEGTRAMLVEVQALVGPFAAGSARRTANGVDGARLAMILAVLERKVGLTLAGADVFLNIAGGVRIEEPAIDLGIALAIASSLHERAVDASTVTFGEVGLTGEVRGVARSQQRLTEAASMGFRRAIVPVSAANLATPDRLTLVPVRNLEDALAEAITR